MEMNRPCVHARVDGTHADARVDGAHADAHTNIHQITGMPHRGERRACDLLVHTGSMGGMPPFGEATVIVAPASCEDVFTQGTHARRIQADDTERST
jgi:hypothetical protein